MLTLLRGIEVFALKNVQTPISISQIFNAFLIQYVPAPWKRIPPSSMTQSKAKPFFFIFIFLFLAAGRCFPQDPNTWQKIESSLQSFKTSISNNQTKEYKEYEISINKISNKNNAKFITIAICGLLICIHIRFFF